jgi:deoxyribonuclease V
MEKDLVTAIEEKKRMQALLSRKVRIVPVRMKSGFVAGVDASFLNETVFAAASFYRYPEMDHVGDAVYRGRAAFPYVPGLFAFREGPALMGALKKLKIAPDLILVDGQGIAHPRGLGIASHIGVILGIPTIGCAKSRLVGKYEEPGPGKGSWTYLYAEAPSGEPIGAVVRTRSGVRPLFVSPGNLADIESSVEIVLRCTGAFRSPEPLRRADMVCGRMKQKNLWKREDS